VLNSRLFRKKYTEGIFLFKSVHEFAKKAIPDPSLPKVGFSLLFYADGN
jgi:hypothetical protein